MKTYENGKYREMTAEEEAKALAALEESEALRAQSQEERIAALEGLADDIVLFMADIIGG